MPTEPKKCGAAFRSGSRCQNPGKPEYGGFCGIHRHLAGNADAPPTAAQTSTIGVVASVVGIASGLATLLTTGVQYMPHIVEFGHYLAQIAFASPTEHDLESKKAAANEAGYITMQHATNTLPDRIRDATDPKDWRRLLTFVSLELPVYLEAGDIPKDLLAEIEESRRALIAELEAQGVKRLDVRPPKSLPRKQP